MDRSFLRKYRYGENGIANLVFVMVYDVGMQLEALRISARPPRDLGLGLWSYLSLGIRHCISALTMKGTYGVTIRELPVR